MIRYFFPSGLVSAASTVLGVTFSIVTFSANGSAAAPHRIPRVDLEIRIDGVLDEPFWEEALTLEMGYEVRPGENIPPPARTEVLLAYDDTHVYAAFRAFDPDPTAIRAHFTDRDNVFNDDWVEVVFDTFNDERRAYDFTCNPLGVQWDFVEGVHLQGVSQWDGIWDSAGKITDWGYVVEMAIPFSTLSFQRSEGDQIWGFDAVRSIPRRVRHHIGLFPRDRNNSCYLCQTEKIIGFAGATPGRNLEFDPTASAILTQEREDKTGGPFVEREKELDVGLTARWGFTPNLTLSATANPDFSQVEADAAQLDINTEFTLFYPEKRPFFLEGADFFETLMNTVHTRSFVNPAWGVKLTGKEGPGAVGFFTSNDEITNVILPGSQSSSSESMDMKSHGTVLRYRRDVSMSSTIGILASDREGERYHNRLAGVDADLRLTPSERIRFQLLGSSSRYPDELINIDDDDDGELDRELPTGEFSGMGGHVLYTHDARNIDWYAEYRDINEDFRADLGFIPQVGIRRVEFGGDYTWWGDSDKWYSEIELEADWDRTEEQDGSLIEQELETDLRFTGPLQTYGLVNIGRRTRVYENREFMQDYMQIFFRVRPSGEHYLEFHLYNGDHIDFAHTRAARKLSFEPTVELRPGRHLTFDIGHKYERLDVEGGRLYTANLTQLKTVYQFDRRTFLRVILQYLDLTRDVNLYDEEEDVDPEEQHLFSQILLSYTINPQTVFFLGYSDNYEGYQDLLLIQTDRTFFVKLGYAWVL